MVNYVNQDDFFRWYNSVSLEKIQNKSAILEDVHKGYCDTHSEVYVIPAEKTVSGKDEQYAFKYDDIGCCGASTVYIYF